MAEEHVAGRLISVDGSRGKDINAGAAAIAKALRKSGVACAISRWDASGLFGEMAVAARSDQQLSARTLSLVYAADLAFRLRWEIRPVLEAGGIVVAAGYVETAIGFGVSRGLDHDWLRELFRLAPSADLRGRTKERKTGRPWKRSTDRGYPEFAASAVDAPKRTRHEMIRSLDEMRGRRTFVVTPKGIDAIVKAATGSRAAARFRSA